MLDPSHWPLGYRDRKQRNTNKELKERYTGYLHRPTSQQENTITTPNAVVRNTPDFLKAGFVSSRDILSSKYLFSFVGIKDKYHYHKDQIKYGEQKQVLYTHEEFKCSL